ncbi:MAG: prolyl oligopeptidase family serine peptidase [Gemmatimonadota bacterium]|nr:prolyl oligopeptidase family serine peptidase [Gemmatimonadota bacterium]
MTRFCDRASVPDRSASGPAALALALTVALSACAAGEAGPATATAGEAAPSTGAESAAVALAPLPPRAFPDTIGVLLERRIERKVPGVPVDDYLLWLPPGMGRGDGEWPLVLWLHGRSLRGTDLNRLKRYGPPAILARGGALPFVLVAPQLPPGGRWADLDPVAALVEDVIDRYPVDPDRVYLLGFSMGGGGAYRMAFDHGDLFAAMVAIAGHTPPPTAENVTAVGSLPFLAIHGELDRRVPLSWGQRMAKALRKADAPDFEFRIEPGHDHSRLERLTRDERIYGWMMGHSRTHPRSVRGAGISPEEPGR